MLTFKKFLSIINEDISTDKMITDIQTQLSQIDNQIAQRTQPLIAQKTQLQRRLGPLLKKKQQDDAIAAKKQEQQPQQQPVDQQNQMQAKQAVNTPGGSNVSTPGTAAPQFR